MSKLLSVLFATLTLLTGASAQTAPELADRYAHHTTYEVLPGVQMTAKFASNGLVCEMQMEQTHFVKDGVDLRNGVEKERIKDLIDQLVPSSERGEKDPTDSIIQGWGAGITEIDSYSNVTVEISSSHGTAVVSVKWRHRSCDR
jgi:hypothetical protein